MSRFPDGNAGIGLDMVQRANLFPTYLFLPGLEALLCAHGSQGLCSSVSHALMHFQAQNNHSPQSSSKEQFSFLWEDYGLFPNPRDPTAGSNGMNITAKILPPLDSHGEFAPVQEAFTTSVAGRIKHRFAWSQTQ